MSPEDADLAARIAAAEAAIEGLPEPEPIPGGLHATIIIWMRPFIRMRVNEIRLLIIGRWRGRIIPEKIAVWNALRTLGRV